MAVMTSYSEDTLADYMLLVTKAVSAAAGIDYAAFAEAVNDTLLAYGVTDIADATDIKKTQGVGSNRGMAMCDCLLDDCLRFQALMVGHTSGVKC